MDVYEQFEFIFVAFFATLFSTYFIYHRFTQISQSCEKCAFYTNCACPLCWQLLPTMLALYSMLLPSYYAQNYAGIIGSSLLLGKVINYQYIARYSSFHIANSYSEVITLIVIRPVCS